jgi:hypothetical protein
MISTVSVHPDSRSAESSQYADTDLVRRPTFADGSACGDGSGSTKSERVPVTVGVGCAPIRYPEHRLSKPVAILAITFGNQMGATEKTAKDRADSGPS